MATPLGRRGYDGPIAMLDRQVQQLDENTDRRFEAFAGRVEEKFDQQEEKTGKRFDALETKVDEKFDALTHEIGTIKIWRARLEGAHAAFKWLPPVLSAGIAATLTALLTGGLH